PYTFSINGIGPRIKAAGCGSTYVMMVSTSNGEKEKFSTDIHRYDDSHFGQVISQTVGIVHQKDVSFFHLIRSEVFHYLLWSKSSGSTNDRDPGKLSDLFSGPIRHTARKVVRFSEDGRVT